MKKTYSTINELSKEFWKNYYKKKKTTKVPNHILFKRMQKDGIGSDAYRLWHNIYHFLNPNSAVVWIPQYHKRTIKHYNEKNNQRNTDKNRRSQAERPAC